MPFLGLAIDPTRTEFERGDFLARGIMALNQRDRSIAVADFVRRGQTVQLLVRDAESAGEDLRSLGEGTATTVLGLAGPGGLRSLPPATGCSAVTSRTSSQSRPTSTSSTPR